MMSSVTLALALENNTDHITVDGATVRRTPLRRRSGAGRTLSEKMKPRMPAASWSRKIRVRNTQNWTGGQKEREQGHTEERRELVEETPRLPCYTRCYTFISAGEV